MSDGPPPWYACLPIPLPAATAPALRPFLSSANHIAFDRPALAADPELASILALLATTAARAGATSS